MQHLLQNGKTGSGNISLLSQNNNPFPAFHPLTTTYAYYPATHANAGELHWTEDGLGKRSYRAYNNRGQLTHQWGPGTYPLRHLYDSYGAMTGLHTWRAGDPGDWDGEAIPAAFGGSAPDITTWVYDAASGLLVQKKDHAGRGPVYAYRDSGLLQSRTWARGITTSYGWNPAGDLASVGYSDGTPGANRTHRRDGSLASVTDAAGTTTYGYAGTIASGESIQGGPSGPGLLDGLTLSYPQTAGRRQSFTATLGGDTVSAMAYGYDSTGRLDSVGEAGLGFSAEFGYAGNSDLPATTVSKAGATTVLTGTRAYDNAGRLASIGYARPGNLAVSSHAYTLDAADRRTRAEREDGTAWVYGYNERDEVVSAVKLLPGEELLAGWQQEFDYDNLGNRKFAREGGDATGANRRQLDYASNALNQYTQISHPGAFDILGRAPSNVGVTVNGQPVARQGEFWRKELGGLPNTLAAVWQPVQVDAVDPGAGPDATDLTARRSGHRFVPMAVETPFYDLDGNLVSDARWVYAWNAENQLIEVTTAAPALAAGVPRERYRFVYDSRSRRIARTVERWDLDTGNWALVKDERFVYDQWNVVAVVDAAGDVVQRFAWGNDLSGTPQGAGGVGGLLAAADAASGRSWCYAYDGNGNVSAVVDLADGAKAGRYDYDAFGRTIATWGDEGLAGVNPYRFSTKPLEGTGLYYYGFRYYMPETGRWLGRDPIEETGGVNLYGFVGNNAIERIDILGNSPCVLVEIFLEQNGNPFNKRRATMYLDTLHQNIEFKLHQNKSRKGKPGLQKTNTAHGRTWRSIYYVHAEFSNNLNAGIWPLGVGRDFEAAVFIQRVERRMEMEAAGPPFGMSIDVWIYEILGPTLVHEVFHALGDQGHDDSHPLNIMATKPSTLLARTAGYVQKSTIDKIVKQLGAK